MKREMAWVTCPICGIKHRVRVDDDLICPPCAKREAEAARAADDDPDYDDDDDDD